MKVVICGAGIAGLTLANRLSALGDDVVLLERASGPRSQGYMIDFFGTGYDAAEAMGLLPAIEGVAYRIEEGSLVDAHGRRRAGVPYVKFAEAVGGRMLSVMRPDLEKVLRDNLPAEVDLRFGAAVVGLAQHGETVTVTIGDGTEMTADLVVGADGIHSSVRRLAFGDEPKFLRYLGFHTAAFVFDSPEVARDVHDRFALTDTVGRQMGFYALRDGEVAAFAVHRTADPTLPVDVRAAVRDTYRGLGWLAPQALDRCPPTEQIYYDQVAQIQMPSWSSGRVVLVGDACHAVSLLAGQGASLGMAGAYLLADRLHDVSSVERALAEYEELWRPVAEERQRTGRAAARWFLPESTTKLFIRRVALRMAWLPVINRFVASTLTGKASPLIKNRQTRPLVRD
jgi:2-polyprenyl-6-methoxyphenol hydroxylase-like FAD-dependent oxidoreductase